MNEEELQQQKRRERYESRRAEYMKKCEACRKSPFPPTFERCDECTVGNRLRRLEAEYVDVTGWSHKVLRKLEQTNQT